MKKQIASMKKQWDKDAIKKRSQQEQLQFLNDLRGIQNTCSAVEAGYSALKVGEQGKDVNQRQLLPPLKESETSRESIFVLCKEFVEKLPATVDILSEKFTTLSAELQLTEKENKKFLKNFDDKVACKARLGKKLHELQMERDKSSSRIAKPPSEKVTSPTANPPPPKKQA